MVVKRSPAEGGRVIEMQYSGKDIRIPLLYPPRSGAIYVRFILDTKWGWNRRIYFHGKKSNPFFLPCWDSAECPVCRRRPDVHLPVISKYERLEVKFCYAWIYQYEGKDSYLRNYINKLVVLCSLYNDFPSLFFEDIDEFTMANDDLFYDFYDHKKSSCPLRIEIFDENKFKGHYKITFHEEHKEQSFQFPDNFPPLSKLFFEYMEEPKKKDLVQYLKNMKRPSHGMF